MRPPRVFVLARRAVPASRGRSFFNILFCHSPNSCGIPSREARLCPLVQRLRVRRWDVRVGACKLTGRRAVWLVISGLHPSTLFHCLVTSVVPHCFLLSPPSPDRFNFLQFTAIFVSYIANKNMATTTTTQPPRPLIVDALNKASYFIPIDDEEFHGAPPWELVAAMRTR